mmetsp:Transcript_92462/g.193285  ORF Transcript_92462/g.193285 Transcript_92462/m.193285 type:complete len:542 (-) Transcript_92462:977-2602(-)
MVLQPSAPSFHPAASGKLLDAQQYPVCRGSNSSDHQRSDNQINYHNHKHTTDNHIQPNAAGSDNPRIYEDPGEWHDPLLLDMYRFATETFGPSTLSQITLLHTQQQQQQQLLLMHGPCCSSAHPRPHHCFAAQPFPWSSSSSSSPELTFSGRPHWEWDVAALSLGQGLASAASTAASAATSATAPTPFLHRFGNDMSLEAMIYKDETSTSPEYLDDPNDVNHSIKQPNDDDHDQDHHHHYLHHEPVSGSPDLITSDRTTSLHTSMRSSSTADPFPPLQRQSLPSNPAISSTPFARPPADVHVEAALSEWPQYVHVGLSDEVVSPIKDDHDIAYVAGHRKTRRRSRKPLSMQGTSALKPAKVAVENLAQVALTSRLEASDEVWGRCAERRENDIKVVKHFREYKLYLSKVPRCQREDGDPQTPDHTDRAKSKRCWKRELGDWRTAVMLQCSAGGSLAVASEATSCSDQDIAAPNKEGRDALRGGCLSRRMRLQPGCRSYSGAFHLPARMMSLPTCGTWICTTSTPWSSLLQGCPFCRIRKYQ